MVLGGGWGGVCPRIIPLLRVPMGQLGSGSDVGVPPVPCLTGHPQLCFCWQRWTKRISAISCASPGGLWGGTAGEPTSPSALAEEACSGLEGQRDSQGASGGHLGHDVTLGLCSVPENNSEALFPLLWAKRGVRVLGTQGCCAPSAKGAEAGPACPSPGRWGFPAAPFSTPISLSPPNGSVRLWGSAGRGWCWGAGAGAGTSALMLPRCHHSSVFQTRGPRTPLPVYQGVECFLIFIIFI